MAIEIKNIGQSRQCHIDGVLSIWEVSEIWKALYPLLGSAGPLHFDLSAVQACDGAGLQLISLIQREFFGRADVRVTAVSEALLQAMQVAGMAHPPLILLQKE
jgi:ABC-type transporter Mla MlaB component